MNSTHLHKAYRPEETILRGFYWEYKYIRSYNSIVATKIHKERVIYAQKNEAARLANHCRRGKEVQESVLTLMESCSEG